MKHNVLLVTIVTTYMFFLNTVTAAEPPVFTLGTGSPYQPSSGRLSGCPSGSTGYGFAEAAGATT